MKPGAAMAALRGVAAALPHLAGLARLVDLREDERVATAGVTASGRLLVNPAWFGALSFPDRVFVLAHELMHLALRSHERCSGTDMRLFNVAHDYIINDMLARALNMAVPADGLWRPGAAVDSAERLVAEAQRQAASGRAPPDPVWLKRKAPLGALRAALAAVGLGPAPEGGTIDVDVIDAATEGRLFPDARPDAARSAKIAAAAERSLALDVWMNKTAEAFAAAEAAARGAASATELLSGLMSVIDAYHAPSWEAALQHWLDEATPGQRSYRRPSRRQGDRSDVVMAGRLREGWMLVVVLDTSGSMVWDEPGGSPVARALGSLKRFCLAADVGSVRIVQAGFAVEVDEVVDPRDLDRYRITGGGGSDMAPAMRMLARDGQAEAVVVVTDGEIEYPEEQMPYAVLWAITDSIVPETFRPGYGRVLPLGPKQETATV